MIEGQFSKFAPVHPNDTCKKRNKVDILVLQVATSPASQCNLHGKWGIYRHAKHTCKFTDVLYGVRVA